MARAATLALAVAACLLGCGGASRSISLDGGRFRAAGLGTGTLTVYVSGAADPVFGECRAADGDLIFEPRFPLRPGLEYRAVFTPSSGPPVERTFSLPAPPAGPPTSLVRIFPSRDTLPENQLKFYLHFSAPMARGEAYRRIHLMESGGKEVDMPFLELGEELWDPSGTRLTLFFDPGRIKRGLKPREEAGPSLEEGKSYTLVVDRAWQDATGRPLAEGARKAFRAAAPDDVQPDPAKWKLEAPRSGSKDPLTVRFEKPLDEAMLRRVLLVTDSTGGELRGRIEIDQEEMRWRFTPDVAWKAGRHALVADTVLEDLAGNSIARPFEVDVVRPVERRITTETIKLTFDVLPGP